MVDDFVLFERWKDGSAAAGNQLFQRHFESIRRFFANKVETDVEDLVQRTFLGCVEGRERFEGRAAFRTYLFAVAHNILREYIRRKRRNQRIDFGTVSIADALGGLSSLAAKRQQEQALLHALRSLPVDAQVLLELYYWERMTGAELGETFGIPENTARSRLRKAKASLREALGRNETVPGGDAEEGTLERWAASIRTQMQQPLVQTSA